MSMRPVKVRLDAERARKVPLSGAQTRGEKDLAALIHRIHAMYPTPPDTPPRDYDVHGRKQARAAILKQLRRERR